MLLSLLLLLVPPLLPLLLLPLLLFLESLGRWWRSAWRSAAWRRAMRGGFGAIASSWTSSLPFPRPLPFTMHGISGRPSPCVCFQFSI
jgi:hypothetical protein